MATAMSVIQDTHAEGIAIPRIREALNQEWARLSAIIQEQTGSPPLRASTATLVVLARAGSESERAREMLHRLASAVPSRAILFIFDNERQAPVASIWAHCTIGQRGKQGHCYDVIEISLPPERAVAIPNIIAVHRLGGLPTFIVWDMPVDFESREFRSINQMADRVVLDTERIDQPLDAMQRYAMFLGTAGSTVIGSDLAWTRLATWRELIAQSFDPPNMARFATEIRTMDLTYDQSQASGAILLASWIVSRLGLRPESAVDSATTLQLRARRPDGSRSLDIQLHHSQRSGIGLRSVRLLARDRSGTAKISILRDHRGRAIHRLEATGMPRQERVVHHPEQPLSELVAAELTRFSRDRIFEEALAIGAQFQRILTSRESSEQ
ncbi:MAG TPA: glucose-6-phosphate dehydrogenase assembly protein OpcA [Thermomicrobiales bacterium]|nr:glucose-6-phosphate dehydrogenase assembly protein OpcA [Thermomicrobiales bacterium]